MTAAAPGATAFALFNLVGLLAFAMVGALKAVDAGLDLFGVVVLGVLTALGGGTLRDVLVGRVPGSLTATGDVAVALVGVALAVALARRSTRRLRDSPALLVPDAVGLSAFAATGALVGLEAGLSPFGVVVLATLTGVGGGSLADLLLVRVPVVLREDFYATPAVVGGAAFWLAVASGPLAPGAGVWLCGAATLALRLLALWREWRLPAVRVGPR
jgi:uncharacterized membrane protein YeiH